jgi:hypothetical protein
MLPKQKKTGLPLVVAAAALPDRLFRAMVGTVFVFP